MPRRHRQCLLGAKFSWKTILVGLVCARAGETLHLHNDRCPEPPPGLGTRQRDRRTGPHYPHRAAHVDAQKLMTHDLPYIPLFFTVEFAAMRDNVRNFVWIPDEIPRFREVWKAAP